MPKQHPALLLIPILLLRLLPGSAQQAKPSPPPKPKPHLFLTTARTQLVLGKIPFRNVGVNIPNLFERFLHGEDASAITSLTNAKDAGVRCVRCFGTTWGSADFGLFQTDPTRWFAAYDRMLAAADKANIAVIPSLLFNIQMLPEYVRKTSGKDEQVVDYLTPGSASNALAVAYVTAVVSRYKNDTRILFWEIGNEYNLEADLSAQLKPRLANQIPSSDQVQAFLTQMATLIKKLDKNHLVTSGNADMRPAAWHLRQTRLAHRNDSDPNNYPMDWTKDSFTQYVEMLRFFNPPPLDIVSVHQYPPGSETPFWLVENDDYALAIPWTQSACERIGKPLFVGEVGQKIYLDGKEQPALWLKDFLRRMTFDAPPLSAIWAWEYDMDNPAQSPYALAKSRTPTLLEILANTNQAIALRLSQNLYR